MTEEVDNETDLDDDLKDKSRRLEDRMICLESALLGLLV